MSHIDPKILAKIKKCLALSTSPNPNEAAVAMRQAHALMRQHGVEAHHVSMAEVGESTTDIRTMARDKPANWEAALAAMVGKAFGCRLLISRSVLQNVRSRSHLNEGQFIFIGQKAQAEVAAYTTSVLARKCKKSRQEWLADNRARFDGLKKSKLTQMGDAYAEGWVHAIGKLVADFANPPEIEGAIERHMAQHEVHGNAQTRNLKRSKIDEVDQLAALMGMQAASGESLYRPMQAKAPSPAIGHTPKNNIPG